MKRKMLAVLCLTLSALSHSWGGDAAEESKKLEGTWLPTSAELAGDPFPADILKVMKLVIKDGKYTVTVGKQEDTGTIKVDPSAKIKSIDVVGMEGPNKGKTFLAIYELNGDTMKVCYDLSGTNRPTEFKTEKKTKLFLVTYKRE